MRGSTWSASGGCFSVCLLLLLGTVACYTGDNTHPQLYLSHIKHAKEVKDYILHASETARRKRRTLNTLNIDADDIDMDAD